MAMLTLLDRETRIDSPGYIIRNQYRNYLAVWESAVQKSPP